MMRQPTINDLRHLLEKRPGPCVSVYMATNRTESDSLHDVQRFRALVREIEKSLKVDCDPKSATEILDELNTVASNTNFWRTHQDGLAVLAARGEIHVFRLAATVKDLAVVAPSFHLKPLFRVAQTTARFDVLCISSRTARLYEGDRYELEPVDDASIPATIEAALGSRVEMNERTGPYREPAGQFTAIHAHGDKKDEQAVDTERYFRAVDQALCRRSTALPLVLVGLSEQTAQFRRASRHPRIVPGSVEMHPDAIRDHALRDAVWAVMEPVHTQELLKFAADYQAAYAHGRGGGDLSDLGRAAAEGRIGTLLVEADRQVPGRIDPATGAVTYAAPGTNGHGIDDLLDDLAESVLVHDGRIVVLPKDRMPTTSGAAAIYRY